MLSKPCAQYGLRLALLAVALDDEPGQGARQEHELVPVRDRLEHREAAHPVPAELGLDVDVVDHLGGENAAVPENGLALVVNRGHLMVCLSVLPLACHWVRSVTGRARVGHRTSLRSAGSRLS